MLSLFLSLQLPTPTEKKASMANVTITSQNEIVSNHRRIKILLHVRTLLNIFFLPHSAKPKYERPMKPQGHKSLVSWVAKIIVLYV